MPIGSSGKGQLRQCSSVRVNQPIPCIKGMLGTREKEHNNNINI